MDRTLTIFILWVAISGCSTAMQNRNTINPQQQAQADAESAITAVIGSVTGQPAQEEDLHRLGKQIHKDKEAQSALKSIAGAVSDSPALGKYCPVDGERYSAQFTECPKHHVPLKSVEE